MSSIELTAPVGQLVAEQPGRGRVFEHYGIDYCCGGKRPLEKVCLDRGLDPGEVIEKLEISDTHFSDGADWRNASLRKLADHIESVHHAYLKEELPRLSVRIAKVARLLWKRYPEIQKLAVVFEDFRAEMEAHIMIE